jgi:hypothetical protein
MSPLPGRLPLKPLLCTIALLVSVIQPALTGGTPARASGPAVDALLARPAAAASLAAADKSLALIEILGVTSHGEGAGQMLVVAVRSDSIQSAEVVGSVQLTDLSGKPVRTLTFERRYLPPDMTTSCAVTVGLPPIEPGKYGVRVALSSGEGPEAHYQGAVEFIKPQTAPTATKPSAPSNEPTLAPAPPIVVQPNRGGRKIELPEIALWQLVLLPLVGLAAFAVWRWWPTIRRVGARANILQRARASSLLGAWARKASTLAVHAPPTPDQLPPDLFTTTYDEPEHAPPGGMQLAGKHEAWQLLTSGQEAARAGNRAEAYRCLASAVSLDPENDEAWLWLAGVLDAPEERASCLRRVLELNPDSKAARQGLIALEGAEAWECESVKA